MKLLFIPGSGATQESWFHQTGYFPDAEGVDLPGHPQGKPCTSIESYVEWMRGYVRGRGFGDVVLGGHSLGGAVTLLYALKYPEELKAIILVGAGARLRVNPQYLERLRRWTEDKEGWVRESVEPTLASFPSQVRAIALRKRLETGPAVTLSDMLCCDRFDIMDQVHLIKLPALIINGTADVMTFVKYARYLHDKIEGSRLVVVEGAGHYVAMERPGEVNWAIEEFLQSL